MLIDVLYDRGEPVTDIQDPYTYLAVTQKLDNFRIFTLGSLMKSPVLHRVHDIPSYIYDFIANEGICLGIATLVGSKVLAITFRSLKEKRFITYTVYKSIPMGFNDFEDFSYYKPVIVVEGPKDLYSIRPIYPNVIATQTAGTSLSIRTFLKGITSRVILLGDSDDSGMKARKSDSYKLRQLGLTVSYINHPSGVKDVGTITDLDYKGEFYESEYLKSYYQSMIEALL